MKSFSLGLFGVLVVILLNGIVFWSWAQKDTTPLSWDESIHTNVAYEYRDRIENQGWLAVLQPAYFNYPPLYHLSLAWALGKTDEAADAGTWVNIFYLGLLLLAIFFITYNLAGAKAGVTAAFLFSCYPFVIEMIKPAMIDIALTTWVTLGFLFLFKSENFDKLGWSLLFGMTLALAMLTKWSALVYLSGPLLIALYRSAQEKRFSMVFVSLGITLLLIAPWYVVNLIPMSKMLFRVTTLQPASGLTFAKGLNWLWYPLTFPEQLNLIFLCLLIPGLFVFIWRPGLSKLYAWFVLPLFIFALIHNRNTRYDLPVLPAAAIFSVLWLPSERKWPYVLVNSLALLFFITAHFFPMKKIVQFGSFQIPLIDSRPAQTGNWKHAEIIEKIQQLKPKDHPFVRVVMISNFPYFHSTSINASLNAKEIRNISFHGPRKRWMDFNDFILLKTGDLGPAFTLGDIQPCADFLKNPPPWFHQVYQEAARWPLPDGSEAILYQVNPKPVSIPDLGVLNISLGEFKLPRIHIRDFEMRAIPLSTADSARGLFKELDLKARSIDYAGVIFENPSVRFMKPQINLPLFLQSQEIHLLSLEGLTPEAAISSEDLLKLVSQKAKWVKEPQVVFEGNTIFVKAKLYWIPVEIKASLILLNQVLTSRLDSLKIAEIPVPLIFLRAVTDKNISLKPTDDIPFNLRIREIRGEKEKLFIKPETVTP